jgi:hypothetical protein
MDTDLKNCIKKAKVYHRGEREFYILSIEYGNSTYYYSDTLNYKNNEVIKHFVNLSTFNERSKWIEK